jgi:predicted HAD superfamily hydrolase
MERSLQNHNHLASYLQARQSSVTTVATFEEDYRRLSTVVLHPSLQRGSIKTLKDLVASERLESAGHTWEIQEAMIYERHAENSKEKDAILAIGFDPSDPNTINHAKVKDITTSTDVCEARFCNLALHRSWLINSFLPIRRK